MIIHGIRKPSRSIDSIVITGEVVGISTAIIIDFKSPYSVDYYICYQCDATDYVLAMSLGNHYKNHISEV